MTLHERLGDLGVIDELGLLKFIDRMKDIIISGGLNISAAEVEIVIADFPGVEEVAVIAAPDEKFGEAITGVVERAPGDTVAEEELITHVKGALAHYKAPKNILFVDTVGRAPNGKVDYKRMKQHALDELGVEA